MQTELKSVTSWELALDKLDKLIEDLGRHQCEVAVILAKDSSALTFIRGSEKGINFLHRHSRLSEDFLQFCTDKKCEEFVEQSKDVPLKVEMEDEGCDSDATIDVPIDEIREPGGSVSDKDQEMVVGKEGDMTDENLDNEITDEYVGENTEKGKRDQDNGTEELNKINNQNNVTSNITILKVKKVSKSNEKTKMDNESKQASEKMLIDFLRRHLENKDLIKSTSETLKGSNSGGLNNEENKSAISKAVLFYDSVCGKETKSWLIKKTGKCYLCNKKLLNRQMENHIQDHKENLEEIVLPCEGCGQYLPKPYLLLHDCAKMAERYMPQHITPIETDIWSFIAIIETQYQWTGFSKGIPCIKCGIKLKTISRCREHLVKQHLKEYHCKLCSKVLQSYSHITHHTVEHGVGSDSKKLNNSDNGNLTCNQCGRQFTKKSSLRRHIERRHMPVEKTYFPCTMCKKKFRSQEVLDKHFLYHEEKWACTINDCNAEYSSALELRKHKRMVHKEHLKSRRFLCSLCGRGFNRKATLTAHMEWKHDAGQPQTCHICNKVCRGKAALRCHLGTHQDKVERQCELCGKTFRTRNSLWKHKKKSHRNQPEIFCCEVCGKTVTTLRSFTHHIISQNHVTENQSVKKEAIHRCPYCCKLFGIKDKLTAHISCVHMQNKQHKCEVCGKAFADKSNYRQHMKIHFGSKPTCKSCKMTFRSELKLKQHLEEHDHRVQLTVNERKYEELATWSPVVTSESGTINYTSEPTENGMNVSVEMTHPYIYPLQERPSPQFILEMKRVEPTESLMEKEVAF